MILYTVPGSCAFACHIALEMSGADYEVCLALREGGRTAKSFFEINLQGRVPTSARRCVWLMLMDIAAIHLVNVLDHRARMLQLPEVQKVLLQEQQLLAKNL